jgi:hypothetical protein
VDRVLRRASHRRKAFPGLRPQFRRATYL